LNSVLFWKEEKRREEERREEKGFGNTYYLRVIVNFLYISKPLCVYLFY